MTDDNRDLRPVKAVQLTHAEDHYIPIAVGTWRRRDGKVTIKQVVGAGFYRVWKGSTLGDRYDTLAEAQEAGLKL